MRFQRDWLGGREMQAVLCSFGSVLAVVCSILCVAPQQAWASPATATATTLAITSTGNAVTTVTSGSVVTLTATVTAGSTPVAPGQINFCDAPAKSCTDIHLLGTAQLTSKGTATLKFRPGPGSHSYKAVFVGTNANAASTSTASALTVAGTLLTTTIPASSGTQGDYSLMATVLSNGSAPPTGTVSFLNTSAANSVLGTAPLTPGTPGLNYFDTLFLVMEDPISINTGDFNGDGIPDIAITHGGGMNPVVVFLGNGDGTFTAAPGQIALNGDFALAVGDFNGDGIQDLAFADSTNNTVNILLGNGDGSFTAVPNTPATGVQPASIAVGDFNGDGIADLAVANIGNNTVTILLGNGDGSFTAAADSPSTGSQSTSRGGGSIAVGDFNGDGKLDLAVANSGANTLTILLGKGNGTFNVAASPTTGSGPTSVAVADLNEDGILDLAVANSGDGTTTILLGKGNGTFTVSATPVTGSASDNIAVGDFNGDGIPDLVVGNASGVTDVTLLGTGEGTFTVGPSPNIANQGGQSVAVADFNGDGISDLAAAANVADADSVLVQLVATNSATATINNIAPMGLGTNLIVADYAGDNNYSASMSQTLPLDGLTFFLSPGSLPADGTGTSTVSVMPEGGFTGTVVLSCALTSRPAGAIDPPTCSITQQPAAITGTAAATGILTVTAQPDTTPGNNYIFTVTGTSQGLTESSEIGDTIPQPAPAGTFALTNTAVSIASPGASGTSTITVTPNAGFTGIVALYCSVNAMAGAVYPPTCAVPAQVAITGTGAVTATLTVYTTGAGTSAPIGYAAKAEKPLQGIFALGGSAAMSALFLFVIPGRRRRGKTLLSVLIFAFLAGAAMGCGGTGNTATPPANSGTTLGTYTVTVTAASGTIMQSTAVTIGVN